MFSGKIDDNIELELLVPRHTQDLFRLTDQNREYLAQWLPWVDSVQQPEDTAQFIEQSQQQWNENKSLQAAIIVHDQIAGTIGHHQIDWQNRKTSLGYWLGKSYQGHGIMTKCCAAVIRHAFEELNLHRVEIHCAVDNKKSRGVPERLGFTEEATLREAIRLNGRLKDRVVYRLLSDEWDSDI